MREPYDSSAQYGRREQDESVLGLSFASLPAFIYLLFFLFVLVVYSANPLEPQVFGFYKLSAPFQVASFFSIFFVPTLLIYFALDLTKSIAHTFAVLVYPLLALGGVTIAGGVTILNVADLPLLAALSGFVLFAFYFLLGLSRSAAERRRRTPRARRVVRPSPGTTARIEMPPQRLPQGGRAAIQRQRASQYAPPSRPQEFKREVRPQYEASDGFLSRLDRFLDRYDYVEGEAVKKGSRRDMTYPRDRRRRGR